VREQRVREREDGHFFLLSTLTTRITFVNGTFGFE